MARRLTLTIDVPDSVPLSHNRMIFRGVMEHLYGEVSQGSDSTVPISCSVLKSGWNEAVQVSYSPDGSVTTGSDSPVKISFDTASTTSST